MLKANREHKTYAGKFENDIAENGSYTTLCS